MAQTSSPLARWDFTLPCPIEADDNIPARCASINLKCKAWAFQLELSETGYRHINGRFSLRTKKRFTELRSLFNEPIWTGIHFSPTANANSGNFNYVIKDDTRIDGPWTDKDKPITLTKQMELFKSWDLYPWQKTLHSISQQFCLRTIDLIYDPSGNAGKSLFSEWMELIGIAEEVPPYRMMDDIFQWVATRPIKSTYIIDMPRGMKKDKLADFYSGLEVIKNGVAFDKRYKAEKVRFSRPRVFVFTNTLPAFDLMSKDRWHVWTINESKGLVTYAILDD